MILPPVPDFRSLLHRSRPQILRIIGVAAPWLAALLVTGCAAPSIRPPDALLDQQWRRHVAAVTPIRHWELRGRLAVQTDSRGGQATLIWRRDGRHQFIQLNGPLGRGMLRVTQDERGARLEDSNRQVIEAADAEQLVAQYTGWQLPIAYLDWWLRGLPVPELAATRELDDQGRLHVLYQQDWTVQVESYTRIADYDLPSRISVSRAATHQNPAIDVRFVIDRWAQVR